jgi:tRNA-specific adenosine deaminase 1
MKLFVFGWLFMFSRFQSFNPMKRIASVVLKHYENLLANGKPVKEEDFTVMAAFVAKITPSSSTSSSKPIYKVISLATGTKCVGEVLIDGHGYILPDSHAEVLARKGLVRFLLSNAIGLTRDASLQDNESLPLMKTNQITEISAPFKLKPNWSFYLYVSDNPCGDSSIYPTKNGDLSFTGAKLAQEYNNNNNQEIDNNNINIFRNENGLVIEKDNQLLGEVRTKSTRSDIIHPTNSMSCSDKVCRWKHIGIQG